MEAATPATPSGEAETPAPVQKSVSTKRVSTLVSPQSRSNISTTLITSQYEPPKIKPSPPEVVKPTEFIIPDVQDGTVVLHKSFGEGIVTKLDKAKKHIRVKFEVGEKTFIFPDAFKNGFLKMK